MGWINDETRKRFQWPWTVSHTFVGLMWITYVWSVWIAKGIDPNDHGMWFGSISKAGYEAAGELDTTAVIENGEWERLVSMIFLHGGLVHLLFNTMAIVNLGKLLEAFSTQRRCLFALL